MKLQDYNCVIAKAGPEYLSSLSVGTACFTRPDKWVDSIGRAMHMTVDQADAVMCFLQDALGIDTRGFSVIKIKR